MIVEIRNASAKVWNSALEKAGPSGTIFQSTFWADYHKKTYGDRPIYIAYLDKKGNILGLLLALESCYAKHPALNQLGRKGVLFGKTYRHAATWLLHGILPFVYWEGGPVVLDPPPERGSPFIKATVYRGILDGIARMAQSRGYYEVKFARPPYFDDATDIFSSAGFEKKRMGTVLVNLEGTAEELLRSIDSGCRRYIRRGREQGIQVSKASDLSDLKQFYDLNVELCRRSGTKIYPYSHFASLWNHFSPINKIVVFISRLQDKPLAGLLCLMHNEMVHGYRIGDSDYARNNRLYATYPLFWHAIEWAHDRGFKYFDLAGVELHKIDAGYKKALGIYRFKSQWGHLVEFHDYEKTYGERRLVKFLNRFMTDSL